MSFGEDRLIIYQNYCTVTMAGKVPLLDYVTLSFNRTEVGTHDPIFVADKQSDVRFDFLLDQKLAHVHDPVFTPIFCLRAGVCQPCVETKLTPTKISATDGN